jgi:uncharacterized protein (UPF0548 family)
MNPAGWADAPPTGVDSEVAAAGLRRDHYEVVLASGEAAAAAAERARRAVLAYRIFPPASVVAALPGMTVTPGSVVVIGVRLGPLGVIAAARVLTVFDRDRDGVRRTGFSYVTLAGHPLRGAETFAVVEDRPAAVARFEMDAVSRPDHWLTTLGAPITRLIQRTMSRAALDRMRTLAMHDA